MLQDDPALLYQYAKCAGGDQEACEIIKHKYDAVLNAYIPLSYYNDELTIEERKKYIWEKLIQMAAHYGPVMFEVTFERWEKEIAY